MTNKAGVPDLSVVIPFYNRAATVQFTLASIARGRRDLLLETILVDDGSAPPASDQLRAGPHQPDRTIRQENRGLLFARLAGLAEAAGEFVLFLDSDDLVGPEKFTSQLAAMRSFSADVSYSDCARAELSTYSDEGDLHSPEILQSTSDSAEFFIRVQPAPHCPIFRTSWLRRLVRTPLFPPSHLYNPVAEIWFYHVAAPHPARIIKVPGLHTIVGQHPGVRLTNNWERLGVASLAVMEAFHRSCPRSESTAHLRRLVGEKAFCSWRSLPYDFSPEFGRRLLAIWEEAPRGHLGTLGGRKFGSLARLLGPVVAAKALRRMRGRPYEASRTLKDDATLSNWLAELPVP